MFIQVDHIFRLFTYKTKSKSLDYWAYQSSSSVLFSSFSKCFLVTKCLLNLYSVSAVNRHSSHFVLSHGAGVNSSTMPSWYDLQSEDADDHLSIICAELTHKAIETVLMVGDDGSWATASFFISNWLICPGELSAHNRRPVSAAYFCCLSAKLQVLQTTVSLPWQQGWMRWSIFNWSLLDDRFSSFLA